MGVHFYTLHTNLPLEEAGDNQLRGDCVFCGKEKHFYVNNDKEGKYGLWDCKVCKREGNIYDFIRMIHDELCVYEPVTELALERGIAKSYMTTNQVKFNRCNNSWVIPTYNKGKMNNLYKVYRDGNGKLVVIGTTSLNASLMNVPEIIHDKVWLTEGFWDKMAGDNIVGPARDVTVIGFPGSGFKASWCNHFGNKELIIFTDKDEAGEKHLTDILNHISKSAIKPSSVKRIIWPDDLKKGYDVNDLLKDKGTTAYRWIEENVTDCETENLHVSNNTVIQPNTSCDTFDKLVNSCETAYHFTEDMELLLLLLLSSVYSLKIEGEQLWLRIIGPPGSSKTTLAKVVGTSDSTVMRDTFTGILSGWKDDQPEDASLIRIIAGKALIVKDADALLQQPNIAQILSEMRSFYDKDIAVSYRHRVSYDYKNIRSVLQLNGTHVLRNMDNAALGDRFVDFELKVTDHDRDMISDRMYERSYQTGHTGLSPETSVWEHSKGFIDHHMMERQGVSFLRDAEKNNIKQFCQLIAYMRAKVEWTRDWKIAYQPHAEVPSRLIGQFTKLYMCAPRVLNSTETGELVHNLVRRVARDIADSESPRFKVCKALVMNPALKRDQVLDFTKLHYDTVNRELMSMIALNMLKVERKRLDSNHTLDLFSLTPKIEDQFKNLINYG